MFKSRLMLFALISAFSVPTLGIDASDAQARGVTKTRKRSKSKPNIRKLKRKTTYKVMRGDSLLSIAKRHGVTTEQIRRWNPKMGRLLVAGKVLTIWTKRHPGVRTVNTHTVKRGETFNSIAKKYKIKVSDLQGWNPRVKPRSLKIGAKLRIVEWTPAGTSTSEGKASSGKLMGGIPLESGKGFKVRHVTRAYGTDITVALIDKCIAKTKARFPKAHDLLIGDISFEKGGYMKPHKSHQSGRDADITYYIKDVKSPYRFNVATPKTLDVSKTWFLFEKFLATKEVTYIFVDYDLQEALYNHAKKKGKSQAFLDKVFQYPKGARSPGGIIRYSKGHDDHFHIRFNCPPNSKNCR